MVTLKLEIPDDQAEALAQLCKRIDYAGIRDGLWALRQALAGRLRAGADRGHRAASRCYANRVVLHRFPSCQAKALCKKSEEFQQTQRILSPLRLPVPPRPLWSRDQRLSAFPGRVEMG
jgi:hypothetical protein